MTPLEYRADLSVLDKWKEGYGAYMKGEPYDPPIKSGDECFRWCAGWIYAKQLKSGMHDDV